jgi:hypothetical protein
MFLVCKKLDLNSCEISSFHYKKIQATGVSFWTNEDSFTLLLSQKIDGKIRSACTNNVGDR